MNKSLEIEILIKIFRGLLINFASFWRSFKCFRCIKKSWLESSQNEQGLKHTKNCKSHWRVYNFSLVSKRLHLQKSIYSPSKANKKFSKLSKMLRSISQFRRIWKKKTTYPIINDGPRSRCRCPECGYNAATLLKRKQRLLKVLCQVARLCYLNMSS